jgi:hypothetical protein
VEDLVCAGEHPLAGAVVSSANEKGLGLAEARDITFLRAGP